MTYKVIIEPIFRKIGRFHLYSKIDEITQTEPFELGFKLKNNGNEPIPGLILKGIILKSSGGQDIVHSINKSFHLDTLNPGSEEKVWVDKLGTHMSGLASLAMEVVPDGEGGKVETYQKDAFTKEISDSATGQNRWIDFCYVRSKTEKTQDINNNAMYMLTLVIAFFTFLNLYLFYLYQVVPTQNLYEKNLREAKTYCKDTPIGEWPATNGGMISCNKVLEY